MKDWIWPCLITFKKQSPDFNILSFQGHNIPLTNMHQLWMTNKYKYCQLTQHPHWAKCKSNEYRKLLVLCYITQDQLTQHSHALSVPLQPGRQRTQRPSWKHVTNCSITFPHIPMQQYNKWWVTWYLLCNLMQATCKKSNSKSHFTGHYFLTNAANNGTILTLSAIIKHIIALESEVELATLVYICKNAIPLCIMLKEMGHCQPKTTIITMP